jgi:chromosome segregation ATPase
MTEAPDNLVLKMLREMRESLNEVRNKVFEHDARFDELRKAIEDWKETTATGVGFAAHANIRTDTLEKEIADLKRRMDRIERSH